MDLHVLIKKFAELEHAIVGKGPKHPDRQDKVVAEELEQFLSDYPAFSRDNGIVEFFERYGAIGLYPPDTPYADLEVITYGFDEEITLSIAHPDESLEDKGYYRFAEVIVGRGDNQYVGAEYAINIIDQEKRGIYHRVAVREIDSRTLTYTWYCVSFLQWLDSLIEFRGGKL